MGPHFSVAVVKITALTNSLQCLSLKNLLQQVQYRDFSS